MNLNLMIIGLIAVNAMSGQTAQSAANQPEEPVVQERSGFAEVKDKAKQTWQRADKELKAQIDQTCNPDRVQTLIERLQTARAPYDLANKNYYEYLKRLTQLSIGTVPPAPDPAAIDDFKKDVVNGKKDLEDDQKKREEAVAKLDNLKARLKTQSDSPGERKESNLAENIEATEQLIETIDETLKEDATSLDQRKNILDSAINIGEELDAQRKKWQLIGSNAEKQSLEADSEATLEKQRIELYGRRRLSKCLQPRLQTLP